MTRYAQSLRFLYDNRQAVLDQARVGIFRTVFLLVCLMFVGTMVVRDQRDQVVKPIEQITSTLKS